jgi:hypothetical protein
LRIEADRWTASVTVARLQLAPQPVEIENRIETHPIRIGQDEWSGVVGVIEGTFTEPMPIGDGKFIEPTGRAYKLTMAAIGHWNEDGVMDEEYLFWDNDTFLKQIGIIE